MAYEKVDFFDRSNRTLNGDTADNGETWTGDAKYVISSNECACPNLSTNCLIEIALATDLDSTNNESISIDLKSVSNGRSNLRLMDGANTVIQVMLYYTGGSLQAWLYEGATPSWVVADTGLTTNTYYNFKVKNIDYTNNKCDFEFNGVTFNNGGSSYQFQTAANKLDKIALYSRDGGTGYFNNIYIGTAPATGWTGKIRGQTNPSKIRGIAVANISKVKGVE